MLSFVTSEMEITSLTITTSRSAGDEFPVARPAANDTVADVLCLVDMAMLIVQSIIGPLAPQRIRPPEIP